ncbi:hypothetical protein EI94DRAFT_1570736, partial [Lactarius quietus]
FLTSADEVYGPITTLRQDNHIVKHIPWSAFKMIDSDWMRVVDVCDILAYFSSKKQPTLWCALPALEELQTSWEKKHDLLKYTLYKDALSDGLAKLGKYYLCLDEKPSFVLALALHLYSKLAYIKLTLGGPDKQAAAIEAGDPFVKDWQDKAKKIVERTVNH